MSSCWRATQSAKHESPNSVTVSGNVTVVEFFDYRCGFCKKVHDAVMDTVKKDGNIKLVYKEYPILGPDSVAATRAALGVFYTMKDKYIAFNDALMRSKGALNEAKAHALMRWVDRVGRGPFDAELLRPVKRP